jgi:glycosyltransferase involved in cell wall biosynthesis
MEKTQGKLVSVIIPTYNRAHLIGETIQSVMRQTYSNWEIIVVDDGSTDNTREVISRFADKNILYHCVDHYGSSGAVRNYGISQSSGEYIAFLDSDDLWRPDKLAFQLELFSRYPAVAFMLSNGSHFGNAALIQPPEFEPLVVGNLFTSLLLDHRFVIYMPSLILKRKVFEITKPINELFRSGGDIDFVYRLSRDHDGIFSNERLVSIRKHHTGMSAKFEETAYLDDMTIMQQFYQEGSISKVQYVDAIATSWYKLGLLRMRKAGEDFGFTSFARHVNLKPWRMKGWIRLVQALIFKMIR